MLCKGESFDLQTRLNFFICKAAYNNVGLLQENIEMFQKVSEQLYSRYVFYIGKL